MIVQLKLEICKWMKRFGETKHRRYFEWASPNAADDLQSSKDTNNGFKGAAELLQELKCSAIVHVQFEGPSYGMLESY